MPFKFFSNYAPTEAGANAHRVNVLTSLIGTGISSFGSNVSAKVQVIEKLTQAIVSAYTACREEPAATERVQHIALALIASAELGLAITLLAQNKTCTNTDNNSVCTSDYVLNLAYIAIQALTWGTSEVMANRERALVRQELAALSAKSAAAPSSSVPAAEIEVDGMNPLNNV